MRQNETQFRFTRCRRRCTNDLRRTPSSRPILSGFEGELRDAVSHRGRQSQIQVAVPFPCHLPGGSRDRLHQSKRDKMRHLAILNSHRACASGTYDAMRELRLIPNSVADEVTSLTSRACCESEAAPASCVSIRVHSRFWSLELWLLGTWDLGFHPRPCIDFLCINPTLVTSNVNEY